MGAEDGAWATTQQSETTDGLPAIKTGICNDSISAAPTSESHLPQQVSAIRESPAPVESYGGSQCDPDISPVQQKECDPLAVEALTQTFQIHDSEDQGTSGTQDMLVSDHQKSSQPAESNCSEPLESAVYLTQQEERVAEDPEAHAQDFYASSGQSTAVTKALLVSPVHESQLTPGNSQNNPSAPALSPTHRGEWVSGNVEAVTHFLQDYASKDQGILRIPDMDLPDGYKSLHRSKSYPNSSSLADMSRTMQRAHIYVSENWDSSVTENTLVSHVQDYQSSVGSNPNNPSQREVPSRQQEACCPNALEIVAQSLQICAFEYQTTTETQDFMASSQYESQLSAKSNLSLPHMSKTPWGEYVPSILEMPAQTIPSNAWKDEGTLATEELVVSAQLESSIPVESNHKISLEPGVSSTHQDDSVPDARKAPASDGQSRSETKSLMISSFHDFSLPAEITPNNVAEPEVCPMQPSDSETDPFDCLAQALLMYSVDQDTSFTQDMPVSANNESLETVESGANNPLAQEVSTTQRSLSEPGIYEPLGQALYTGASKEQCTSATQDLVLSVVQESILPLESDAGSPLIQDVSAVPQDENVPGAFETLAEGLLINASEEQCMSGTQDWLAPVVQDCSVAVETNFHNLSVQEVSPAQQEVCVPGAFEALALRIQMHAFKDQGISGIPVLQMNDRKRSVHESTAGNCLSDTAVFTSLVGVTKHEENEHTHRNEAPTPEDMSGARNQVATVRSNSMSGSGKSSSNNSAIGSPNICSSRLSFFDSDDETDRAESFASLMSLVDFYSDYFEDLEENQSEEYVLSMITTYVDVATDLIGNLRLVAARIFTSPQGAGNILYDISWTVLYLAVDEEVDLYDVGSCYKLRLLAVKAYIRTTCENTAEGAIAETIRQEFLAKEHGVPGEPISCTRLTACILQETVRARGGIPFSSGEYGDGVITAPDRTYDGTYSKNVREGEHVYSEIHQCRYVDDSTCHREAVLKVYSIAEERVCRIRAINGKMLSCFKTVLNVLGLGLEANRMAQRAVKEALRHQLPDTNHVVVAAMQLAMAATNHAETALSEMEQAVELHRIVVRALRQAERSLYNLRLEACCGRNDLSDIIAYVDVVEEAVESACDIYLDKASRDVPVDASWAVLSRDTNEFLSTSTMVHQRSDDAPRDVFQALFWATRSAITAIDVTLQGLRKLSFSMLFNVTQLGR
ncbi:uncharacterized protein LOC126327349 [Schistocerca gregaria]|uniref:uncharacterized protein LOC126327349 n=1 Tax=Schistocerca gregaria TaxID=7010 RepID=UPI00211E409F|nr:uncharacterized protein LOC126327349 [Schistocerca gregaria]XP_049851838.1 uncharacterized protein LOC126327349 [Schistocerca gregaria]